MKYINASDLLPPALVQTLQEYVQGGYVYIPAREHKSWGEKSGSREALAQRTKKSAAKSRQGQHWKRWQKHTIFLSLPSAKLFIRKRNKKKLGKATST